MARNATVNVRVTDTEEFRQIVDEVKRDLEQMRHLIERVGHMRAAQREYYATRGEQAYKAAIALEREVDKLLREHLDGQKKLF